MHFNSVWLGVCMLKRPPPPQCVLIIYNTTMRPSSLNCVHKGFHYKHPEEHECSLLYGCSFESLGLCKDCCPDSSTWVMWYFSVKTSVSGTGCKHRSILVAGSPGSSVGANAKAVAFRVTVHADLFLGCSGVCVAWAMGAGSSEALQCGKTRTLFSLSTFPCAPFAP